MTAAPVPIHAATSSARFCMLSATGPPTCKNKHRPPWLSHKLVAPEKPRQAAEKVGIFRFIHAGKVHTAPTKGCDMKANYSASLSAHALGAVGNGAGLN